MASSFFFGNRIIASLSERNGKKDRHAIPRKRKTKKKPFFYSFSLGFLGPYFLLFGLSFPSRSENNYKLKREAKGKEERPKEIRTQAKDIIL